LQIVFSALTAGSFLVIILSDENLSAIIGAIISLLLLMLNTYAKDISLL